MLKKYGGTANAGFAAEVCLLTFAADGREYSGCGGTDVEPLQNNYFFSSLLKPITTVLLTVRSMVPDGVIYGRTDGDLRCDFTVTVSQGKLDAEAGLEA